MNESDLIGTLVDSRYRIEAIVGSGGFGTVYRAVHVALGGAVAVKVPRTSHLAPRAVPSAVADFLDEGRVLKRLRHPNLVGALDLGLLPPGPDGVALPYLVLEWCDGPSLKEWLASQGGALGRREAWQLLRPVFDAVAYAHEEGVVHRDLKPANILLESSRGALVPRVIDFGIAKLLDPGQSVQEGRTGTAAAHTAYTPRYAAPEQLTGTRTGPRTDVYALALLLLEAVLGRPVFASDEDALAVILDPGALSSARLGYDLGGWNDVLGRALSTRPEVRQQGAGELLRELDASLPPSDDSRPVPAAPAAGTTTPPRPPSSSKRTFVIGAAALAVLAAVGIAWGSKRHASPPPSEPPSTVESAEASAPGHSKSTSTAIPLRQVSVDELLARALAGGLQGCAIQQGPGSGLVACGNGMIMTRDGKFGRDGDDERIRLAMQFQAKLLGKQRGGARFTTDDAMGIVIAGPANDIEALTTRVLDGVRHDAIGNETPPPFRAPVAARLRDWTGPALATRAEAAGIDLVSVELAPGMASVSGDLNGQFVTVMLVRGDPPSWVAAARRSPAAFSYASDGDQILVSYASKPDDTAFLKTLLGSSTAAKIEKGR